MTELPIRTVFLTDEHKTDLILRAETAAIAAGVPLDAWRGWRAKNPAGRDVLMLADPIGERDRIQQVAS